MIIDLYWTDLKPISEIDFTNIEQGVYVWGFMFEEKFIPYYVGNAYNIQSRLTEHVSSIIGGRYCIIHENNLHKFYKYKDSKDDIDGFELLYTPNFPKNYITFLEQRKKLQPHIDKMVKHMYYSYSAFNGRDITKKQLELIEKKCIQTIGINKLWNRKCGKCDDIFINSVTGEKQLSELFK